MNVRACFGVQTVPLVEVKAVKETEGHAIKILIVVSGEM